MPENSSNMMLTRGRESHTSSPVMNATQQTKPTFTVLFPIFKGSKKFRQIGITNDPAANYKPGVTIRFRNEETGESFVLTGGGLVKVTA